MDDLCRRPGRADFEEGSERVVFGLCSADVSADEIQAWARNAGLDPFGVESVSLSFLAAGAAEERRDHDAAALLASLVARARAFRGSEPQQMKLRLRTGRVSRRALLSLPPVAYDPLASVDPEGCVGQDRCGLCIDVCPADALAPGAGVPAVDGAACWACGLCVTTCPAEAISVPGASLEECRAQIEALLSWYGRPRAGDPPAPGLLLACRRDSAALEGFGETVAQPGGWLPVQVPCLAMVTPGWILQAVAGGAAAVGLLSCGVDCRSAGDDAVAGRAAYCRDALEALGLEDVASRVRALPGSVEELARSLEELPPAWRVGGEAHPLTLLEPAATAEAILRLGGESWGEGFPLESDSSPLGLADISDACTACGACVAVCPTSALALEATDRTATLTYDPNLCIPCGRCVPVCPERAVTVRPMTSPTALRRGRAVVKREPVKRCRKCGRPVAPTAMLDRVRSILAREGTAAPLLDLVGDLCASCRGFAGGPSR